MRPLAALLLLMGCTSEARFDPSPGLHLGLRVSNAQLIRGPLREDEGGPVVSFIQKQQQIVRRGEADVTLSGRLGPGGRAIHIQLAGDADHWVLPAAGFDFAFPNELLWRGALEFSANIQSNTGTTATVLLQAFDETGTPGPARSTDFLLAESPPPSTLSVSLGWDRPVDLDLHVRLPDGEVLGAKNINAGAILDFDSNQACLFDGRQVERALWQNVQPTPGSYEVFVHLYAPCDQPVVNFEALVHREGQLILRAQSTLYEFDARTHPRDAAPGLLLMRFEVE